jgi:hypothetical protein
MSIWFFFVFFLLPLRGKGFGLEHLTFGFCVLDLFPPQSEIRIPQFLLSPAP